MKDFNTYLKQLNSDQLKAVETIEGPVMVIAGPGTGKTYTLTLRIANILAQTDAKPNNILALTFTDNAAKNMQERLVKVIGNDAYKVKIMTFHSFCNEVIQLFPDKFGFNEFYSQINDLEKIRLIEQVIDNTELEYLSNFADPYMYKKDIAEAISELKKESITPAEFSKFVTTELNELEQNKELNKRTGKVTSKWNALKKKLLKNRELATLYVSYQDMLKTESKYDYDDMILYVTESFEKDEELLAYFQEQYLYVLVDEFQDTNGAQSRILELLGSYDDSPNLFVVGDDAQSIFRFQGANIENMYDFLKKFPKTTVINLKESYRCPQGILSGAESLLSHNEQTLGKILGHERAIHSNSDINAKIQFAELDTYENEYFYVVNEIQKLIKEGVAPREIAVIYKKHADASLLKDLLAKSKIAYSEKAARSILDSKYIIEFINLLKLIQNPTDNKLFFEVANYEFNSIERLSLFRLANEISRTHQNMIDVALSSLDNKLKDFGEKLLQWQKDNHNQHLTELLLNIANKSYFIEHLKASRDIESIQELSSLYLFAKRISKGNFEYKLENFLLDINSLIENRLNISLDYINPSEGVNLLTVHGAKGLEFDYIFILNLYEGKWSNVRDFGRLKLPESIMDTASDKYNKNEEERRLLYVAITRAKKAACLMYSHKQIEDGREKEQNKSQFISEIKPEYIEKVENLTELTPDKLALLTLSLPEVVDLDEKEKLFLQMLLQDFKLSATSLNNYLEDPQKFLYESLLRIPTTKSEHLIVGTIVHKVLELYHKDVKKGSAKKIESYTKIVDKLLSNETITLEQKERIQKEANRYLTNFLTDYRVQPEQIINTEYNFGYKNILLKDIALTGKIDLIENISNSDSHLPPAKTSVKPKVRIVDFKTGRPKTRNEILGLTKNSDKKLLRQLQFYKLLALLDSSFNYEPVEFELRFIKPQDNGKIRSEIFSSDEIDIVEIKTDIVETMGKIRSMDFNKPI